MITAVPQHNIRPTEQHIMYTNNTFVLAIKNGHKSNM